MLITKISIGKIGKDQSQLEIFLENIIRERLNDIHLMAITKKFNINGVQK